MEHLMARPYLVCWMLACSLAAVPAAGRAQQPAPALRGTVMDAAGGVLVGATVEVTAGERSVTAVTDERGQYQLPDLPPGDYVITVRYTGFEPTAVRHRVTAGSTTVADVVLRVLITAEVYVAPSAEPGEGAAASLFTRVLSGVDLDTLPSGTSALQRRLQELAGATGRPGDLVVYVDGFRRVVRLPPREAIHSIRISNNPFAAEFSEPGHSRVEILTKAGFNTYSGQLTFNFNDRVLNAKHPFVADRAALQRRNYTAYVSGPVIDSKWSLVAYAGHWEEDRSEVVNATILGAGRAQPEGFAREILTPRTISNGWLGSTHQLGAAHVLAVSLSQTREEARNQGLDGGLDLPERAFSQHLRESLVRVAATSAPNPRMVNELRVEGRRNDSGTTSASDATAVSVLDAFNAGGNQANAPRSSRADSLEVSDQFTFALGHSTIKVGAAADGLRQHDTNRVGFGGTFVFGSDVERGADGRPLPGAQPGAGPVDPLEAYRRTLAGVPGYAPSQFWIVEGNPDVAFTQWWAAWFAQADWTPTPRFTLSYGLRQEWASHTNRTGPISPRVGLAWSPTQSGRNTIRAGAGIFFDRLPASMILDSERLDGTRQRRFTVADPAFFPAIPADWASDAVLRTPSLSTLDPALEMPRSLLASIEFDRRLAANLHASVAYAHQRGTHLLRSRNVNAPIDGVRPDPEQGPILQYESSGRSERHEFMIALRTNWTRAVSAFANYTLASTRSDTDGPATRPADSYDLTGEFAPGRTDARHQGTAGVTLRLESQTLISLHAVVSSGRPFNITTGRDRNRDTIFTDRPAFADPFDPDAIETPWGRFDPTPEPGDAIIPRNFGREPLEFRMDLHVQQSFPLGLGRARFRLGADITNVLNRPNRSRLNGVLTSSSFGRPRQALDPRSVDIFAALSY